MAQLLPQRSRGTRENDIQRRTNIWVFSPQLQHMHLPAFQLPVPLQGPGKVSVGPIRIKTGRPPSATLWLSRCVKCMALTEEPLTVLTPW